MSVKLRVLAEADVEYAKELKEFFSSQGIDNYLDMTIEEFVQFCENKVVEWNQKVMEGLKKRDNGRNCNF